MSWGMLINVRSQVKTPQQEAKLQENIRGIEKKPLPHLLCSSQWGEEVAGVDFAVGGAGEVGEARSGR
jgi:hypothetical protein